MLLLLACTPEPAPKRGPPPGPGPAAPTLVPPSVLAPAPFTQLLREGQAYGGPGFGTVPDAAGAPLPHDGRPTCSSPDFTGIFPAHGKTWAVTHLECAPAALVLSELVNEGGWKVARSAPIDLAAVHGLNLLCSGQVTPWGTLLSGEEYETDLGLLGPEGFPERPPGKADDKPYVDWSGYQDRQRYAAGISPWWNGMMVETRVTSAEGGAQVERHPAMGRFSHELGLVMPDQRTVLLSDDTTYGGLYAFVADQPGQLSAGRLYAARIDGDATWKIDWIDLGHATDAAVTAAVTSGVTFPQLFRRHPPPCNPGETARRGTQRVDECVAVVGDPAIASRLDTRRYAATLGATVELEKAEGLALDVERKHLYLALTRVANGLTPQDPPTVDHLRMIPNPCGVVMRLELGAPAKDQAGAVIDSAWLPSTATVALAGRPSGQTCAEGTISNPDNLTWVPEQRALYIAEDTARSPNRLWAWDGTKLVEVWAAPPAGEGGQDPGEVTGLGAVVLDGQPYVTVSVQRPSGAPAFTGLVGPLPTR